MVRVDLAVYPGDAIVEHLPGEGGEGALARVRDRGKHRLAEDTRPDGHAVEAADKPPEKAADLNGDGNINLKDVTLLRRSIAGGWDKNK